MASQRYALLEEKIERAIKAKPQRDALYRAMKRGRDSRDESIDLLPGGKEFFKEVTATKHRCLEQQDELLEKFANKVRERGASVFMAEDGPAAIDYILKIARERGAKIVGKSKSLTSEEIEVNKPLEEAGLEVIETDLGELIIQKVGQKPYHLVFPSVHITAPEVAKIFRKATGKEVPDDIDGIMKVVRKYLRPIFMNADIGMTGANVGIAETGAIVIETNEGNARMVSSIPNVHICIMGIEKIVDTFEDAMQMMLAHPISAIGQHLTTYVTLMGGRSPLGDGGAAGSRESHIIILDNGRTRMREDPVFKDALNCIRCGACMNICPTSGVVGGHTFGHIYPGPMGIPWTSEVHGLEKAGDFAPLCISCGLCREICPVDIDLPFMIAEVKDRDSQAHPHPTVDRVMMAAEVFAKMGSFTAPVSNWLLSNWIFRLLMEKTIGVDRRRELPAFRWQTLVKRFKKRGPSPVSNPVRKAVYFVDLYANYNAPELGMAAVEQMEKRNCQVALPEQKGCGYPYVAYGNLKKARKAAEDNIGLLASYVEQGYDVVTTEPTAAYALKKSYPKLLPNRDEVRKVAERTYQLFEYLELLDAQTPSDTEPATPLKGRKFGFHIPCHQRPLGSGSQTIAYLRKLGAEVQVVENGTCCGMAGTFGMKKGMLGYELSQTVGEPLFELFKEADIDIILTESSVCAIHLTEGTRIELKHPLEIIVDES